MKRLTVFLITASLSLAACNNETTVLKTDVLTATAQTNAGAYNLEWTLSSPGAVDVLVSSEPTGETATLIGDDITASNFTWTASEKNAKRRYFIIAPEHGEPLVTATRLLPLEGGRNFRDLGGYKTEDGRRVKWGQIYRSGVMTNLTKDDYGYLSDLGIKVVCDLRTSQERTTEPTNWTAGEIEYLTFPDPDEDTDQNPLVQVFSDPDVTPEKVSAMMTSLYSGILEQQTPAYKVMFDELANGELPLTFNCSAGKDRTGVGAALILSALGVPRETIVKDYALSEKVVDYMAEFNLQQDAPIEEDSPYAFLRQLPPRIGRTTYAV